MCALLSKFHCCHDGVWIWPLSYCFLSRGFLLFISRPQFLHRRQSCCDKQRKMKDKLSLPGKFFQGNCYNVLSFFSISLSSKRKNIASVFQLSKPQNTIFYTNGAKIYTYIKLYINIFLQSCIWNNCCTPSQNPRTTQREGLRSSAGLETPWEHSWLQLKACMLPSFTGHLQWHTPPYLLFNPFQLNLSLYPPPAPSDAVFPPNFCLCICNMIFIYFYNTLHKSQKEMHYWI